MHTIFRPGDIGNLTLKNRIIKAGCFEGMSQGGRVTEKLIQHHQQIVKGGTAMTTVAYCSVSFDGRAFDHELWMREEILPDLQKLTLAVHQESAAASIQLGHCGYFSSPSVIRSRPLGASRKFNLFRLSFCKTMTKKDIREKVEDFGRAALMAKKVGFDAVEVHAGHGYLLSQFISPWTNKRTDNYGGSLQNRMRFPKEVICTIRELAGPDFPILVKMNQYDGMRGGLELEEAIEAARIFEEAGASALIPSCGFTSKTPLQMLRGHVPVKEMVANQKDPVRKTGLLLFGKTMVQHYRYERLFLLSGALKIKEAVSIPVIYIGGVKDEKDILKVLDSGLDFVQLGRTLIHDAEFVNKMQSGKIEEPLCDHCNRCVAAMDGGGVKCVSRETGRYLSW